jgi:hypothetical protein
MQDCWLEPDDEKPPYIEPDIDPETEWEKADHDFYCNEEWRDCP